MKQVLLLSGGMDSAALAWALRPEIAVTINYGQLAAAGELKASSSIVDYLKIPAHRVLTIDCGQLGSGDMAGAPTLSMAPVSEWWPFRNQLLITFAAAVALKEDASELVIGAVSSDVTHADGREQFFQLMRKTLEMQEGHIRLSTPALELTTPELCRKHSVPFEFLSWSHSCHVADYACGRCRGCVKHRRTMVELGYDEY